LPEFVLGILLAHWSLKRQVVFHQWRCWAYFLGAILVLCTVRSGFLSLLVIPFSGLIYELAAITSENRGIIAHWLTSKWLVFLGGASYSVYLLQFPIRNLVLASLSSWGSKGKLIGVSISPLMTIMVSCLVFHYYEEPCRKFLKRWLIPRF
jgi:peptidoglycan/LPS O-acetylase OafA/YrhL